MNLADLSVRTKLFATLGILIVSMLVINVVGLSKLEETTGQVSQMYEARVRPIADVGVIYGAQLESVQLLDEALALQSRQFLEEVEKVTRENRALIAQRFQRWTEFTASDESRRMQAEVDKSRSELMLATDEILRALATEDYPQHVRYVSPNSNPH